MYKMIRDFAKTLCKQKINWKIRKQIEDVLNHLKRFTTRISGLYLFSSSLIQDDKELQNYHLLRTYDTIRAEISEWG